MARANLTVKRLREVLDYDADTGIFTWKISPASNISAGRRAGSKTRSARQIKVDKTFFYEHRLAWLHVFGEWPQYSVDHIDGDPFNNALGNLRDVQHRVNIENQRSSRIDNKLGLLGVSHNKFSFVSSICVAGKTKYIGSFKTAEEAHQAYLEAKRRLHVGCTI